MRYFGQDNMYILAECLECNKVLKVKRQFITESELGYIITPSFNCFCGQECTSIEGKPKMDYIPMHETKKNTDYANQIKCPKCKSTQITSAKKGFGLGKAAAGGLLLGPVGLLGGLIGSNEIQVVCLNCGKRWKPGV